MGEYATYNGDRIKIGTCEDLYYLRASQVRLIDDGDGSEGHDVAHLRQALDKVRFRFPWPDEDGTEPGAFDPYNRAVAVPRDVPIPATVKHHSVQFVAQRGYNVCLPCPEGPDAASHGLTVHRNGFAGKVQVVQQAYRNGHLAVICQCGGCGTCWNLPTLAEAEPIIVAFRAEGDRKTSAFTQAWWHTVADRIAAGYRDGAA